MNFGERIFYFQREANFLRFFQSYFYLVHPFHWSGPHGLPVTYIKECLLAWVLSFVTNQRQGIAQPSFLVFFSQQKNQSCLYFIKESASESGSE